MGSPTANTPRLRIQYAALPFRRSKAAGTEIMLVTSRETGRWVVPKGWPHKHKTPSGSAAKEAREEAGVVGVVRKQPIGIYTYGKRLKSGKVVDCEVQVFPLKVKRQQKTWREKGQREIQWFLPTGAVRALKDPNLAKMIRKLAKPR